MLEVQLTILRWAAAASISAAVAAVIGLIVQ